MDPIIMIGVPPILIAVIAVPCAIALGIATGCWNFRERREAEEAAEASSAKVPDETGADGE